MAGFDPERRRRRGGMSHPKNGGCGEWFREPPPVEGGRVEHRERLYEDEDLGAYPEEFESGLNSRPSPWLYGDPDRRGKAPARERH